jgi:hypothetical protein
LRAVAALAIADRAVRNTELHPHIARRDLDRNRAAEARADDADPRSIDPRLRRHEIDRVGEIGDLLVDDDIAAPAFALAAAAEIEAQRGIARLL